MAHPFEIAPSELLWRERYAWRDGGGEIDRSIADTWRRVARAAASAEGDDRERWEQHFLHALEEFRFLPGGRILAAAGTARRATLCNCFVMGVVEDSVAGIFAALEEGALTMQMGGGVGYDFSTLRPRGTPAHASGNVASGPVSFMRLWDAACATITGTSSRGGAMMATLRADHPDVLAFIDAKRAPGELSRFNLSLQVTDELMRAVESDAGWPLVFPAVALTDGGRVDRRMTRCWTGGQDAVDCAVIGEMLARDLWEALLRASYDHGDPGVLFVDAINRGNNLHYCERLTATNPCGEQPLPPYGACDLGSLNLTRFVLEPWSRSARIDLRALEETTRVAVRLLDDVLDVSEFPLPRQREQALHTRRIGLGITGLADTLILLGLHYDSEEARDRASQIVRTVRDAAYEASIALAREKSSFPAFRREAFLASTFVEALPARLRDGIARDGLRNSHLLAIAPAGSISLLANGISSGIEPVFTLEGSRLVRRAEGAPMTVEISDYAWRHWLARSGREAPRPAAFVTSYELAPAAHLAMQAALQPFVDGAISKTINLPRTFAFESYRELFRSAYRLGLKGCTAFRPNEVTGQVLSAAPGGDADQALAPARQCCLLGA